MEDIVMKICERIAAMQEKTQILVAIDGSCTSGKSTLADMLEQKLDCNLFHMDDFFLRPEQRTPERLAQTGGNVDYERFRAEVLLPLKAGGAFSYRPYDCSTGKLKDPVTVQPKRINVVEGTYSCHPRFEGTYDLTVFLQVTPAVRRQRILSRPVFLQKRFFEEWIPMEQAYFADFSIGEKSDLTVWPKENQ